MNSKTIKTIIRVAVVGAAAMLKMVASNKTDKAIDKVTQKVTDKYC